MTDEQRKHLVQILGPINEQAAKNKLETAHEEAERQLQDFIKLRRIDPEALPHYKVQKVVVDYNCMTIVTDTFHYVQVSAEPGYEGCVNFCTLDQPDIEDAHNMGILSDEQYDEYKVAQQAHLKQRREMNTHDRLRNIVREAGATAVQEYLNELGGTDA